EPKRHLSGAKVHHAWSTRAPVFLPEFNKVPAAFLAAMEKHAGGVTAEQKKEWEALFDKAYSDMKSWGWF
ncbi:hypothetical protein COOONC_12855, partial [Cooperia oncophora]